MTSQPGAIRAQLEGQEKVRLIERSKALEAAMNALIEARKTPDFSAIAAKIVDDFAAKDTGKNKLGAWSDEEKDILRANSRRICAGLLNRTDSQICAMRRNMGLPC